MGTYFLAALNIVSNRFIATFKQPGAPEARGKFLSRVFGIFSEEIVRIWAADPHAPFEDIGRPTLRIDGEQKGSTLDFTFRSRRTGRVYAAELKCEIEYQRYRYFILNDVEQLRHHHKPAFDALLAAAAKSPGVRAYIQRQETPIDGAILIWGDATPEGRTAVMRDRGFFDVLTISHMVADLQAWKSDPYRAFLGERRDWCGELFDGLCKHQIDASGFRV